MDPENNTPEDDTQFIETIVMKVQDDSFSSELLFMHFGRRGHDRLMYTITDGNLKVIVDANKNIIDRDTPMLGVQNGDDYTEVALSNFTLTTDTFLTAKRVSVHFSQEADVTKTQTEQDFSPCGIGVQIIMAKTKVVS